MAAMALMRDMDRDRIIAKLREHESELKDTGIEHLSLFGSYARGTAIRETSDVDLMAEFNDAKQLSLLELAHIQNLLGDILGAAVDLSPAKLLKDRVRKTASREAVLAF
jgi:uncharacterized protein